MKKVLIYKLFQKEKAMIGEVISESTSMISGGAGTGGYDRHRRFKVGDKEFSGDYGVCPFTIKKCLQFKTISSVYEE